MSYMTIAIGRQMLYIGINEYGHVTILNQRPMTEEEIGRCLDHGMNLNGINQLGAF